MASQRNPARIDAPNHPPLSVAVLTQSPPMNWQRLFGVVAATAVAAPAWLTLAVDRPHIAWFSAAVALAHLGFAVLIGVWVTQHPRGRSWLADRGAVATWAGLGGLAAAPALVLQSPPVLAAVALAGLAAMVTALSPVLSERAVELLEQSFGAGPAVRPLPKLNEQAPASPSSLVRTLPPFGSGPRAA